MREKQKPAQEIAFPVWEKQNPAQEIAFPVREKQNADQEIAFPVREKRNPTQEIAFPVREKQNSTQESLFLRVVSSEYHNHRRFSCLGRKFRLDEPQRKKDFRKRSLQDVVPAPPSVKDQAFDQQCIEEHHEWRRNDPPA